VFTASGGWERKRESEKESERVRKKAREWERNARKGEGEIKFEWMKVNKFFKGGERGVVWNADRHRHNAAAATTATAAAATMATATTTREQVNSLLLLEHVVACLIF
jgi:hypothetical protein